MGKYRVVSSHGEFVSGRPTAPDTEVTLTKKEETDRHNKRLIEEGVLVKTDTTPEETGNQEGGTSDTSGS